MDEQTWRSRRTIRVGATTAALAATLLLGGAAAAQDTGTTPAVPTIPDGTGAQSPDIAMAPGGGPGTSGRSDRGASRGGGTDSGGGMRSGRGPGAGGGAMRGSGGPDQASMGSGRGSVEVVANDGTSLTLQTQDGWSRTIDTTGVVLTSGETTIATTDISVGDKVRIAQTRNADGSYTVTGIQLLPAQVTGAVAAVSTDGFTLTDADGTTVSVRVSATTTWRIRGDTTPGLSDLTAGTSVVVTGDAQDDGSIDATSVSVR